MGNVLVIAEHLHGKFPKTTLVGLAAGQGAPPSAAARPSRVVLGKGVDALATRARRVRRRRRRRRRRRAFEHYLADAYTAAIAELVKQKGIETVVATATAVGKDLAPRVAARLGAAHGGRHHRPSSTRRRSSARCTPATSIATVEIEGTPRVISVRATAFDAAAKGGSGNVEKVAVTPDVGARMTVRRVRRDQVRPARAHRGAHRRLGRPRPQERRELHDLPRAAVRRARRRHGRQPRRRRRRLRAERPAGRPDRQGRRARSSTSRSASRAPSSTSPA